MIVINSIIILGGTHAEHIHVIKSKPMEEPVKDVFPDHFFLPAFLIDNH